MKRWPLLAVLLGVFALVVVGLAVWRANLPPPPILQPPNLPLSFAQITPAAKLDLEIDPRLKPYPVLVRRLYQSGVQELRSFAAQAAEDQARLKAKGLPVRPYERTITWRLAAATPNLLSAEQSWFDDTGGAHPNSGSKGLLWDPYTEREVSRYELFRPDADQGALDQMLCRKIQAEKAGRLGAVFDPTTWPCPKWSDADFVLAGSSTPHKLGGIVFLFDPYSIGPYVEGEWRVLIPQSEFKNALSTSWAGQFAGQPQ
jgi:Protein of unknown function (DUF3298)